MSHSAVASLVLLFLALRPSASAEADAPVVPPAPLPSTALHHAFRLTPQVLSGGTPDSDQAFSELRRLGVTTILSVDGAKPDLEAARRFGLRYVHLPVGYDGIPSHRVAELVKAAQTSPGILYIHCHHGTHRGPAAAAIVCQGTAGWNTNQAIAWLRQAGTSTDYPGLFQTVLRFQAPSVTTLEQVHNLPETTSTSSVVDTMVTMDAHLDHLKASQKAGWKPAPSAPVRSPHESATLLWEQVRELRRTADTGSREEGYRALLQDAENAAQTLRNALADGSSTDVPRADVALQALGRTCTDCHKRHRN